MTLLSLTLCGRVTVKVDGAPRTASRLGDKAVALLAYLAIARGRHSRSALAALLWSEQTDDHARVSLRQGLKQIRQALGPVLHDDGGWLALDAQVVCDVDVLLDDGAMGGTELDVSHFLTELPVRGASAFDEWAAGTRERLRACAAGRLATTVAQALARHDPTVALAAAERWCALVPLDDAPAMAVAHVLEQAGRAAEGLARLDAFTRRVRDETGHAPGTALTALAERLRKLAARQTDWGAVPAAPGRHEAMPGAREEGRTIARLLEVAPLQERDAEWRALVGAWTSARDGAGGVVLIEGEHGVGTSRLLRDLGRWVAGTGGTVLQAAGLEADRSVPFGVLAHLVHAAVDADGAGSTDGRWLAELARLDPTLHARFPGVPPMPATSAVDGWRVFEALAQVLTVLADDGPVLVLLDDLPWCDAETAGLLHSLVERTRDIPVLWCAAATVGVAGRESPGAQLARAFAGTSRARVVWPHRLSATGVRGIVNALGALRDLPAAERRVCALVERVQAESEGLPLFAIALLRELHAAGALAWAADAWDVHLAADQPIPVRLADIDALRRPIGARIERLAEDERQVLVTIALAELPCDVELISRVQGISRLRAAVLCNGLCASGLLTEEREAFRCAPRLVAEVVQAGVGEVLRRETVRAIAAVLRADSGPTPPPVAATDHPPAEDALTA